MKASYITHAGDDLLVVNAARVSFDKHKSTFDSSDEKLINYLASHGHWTPFGHSNITLRIEAPVAIRTQCFKHKIGFIENEVSRRYVDDAPEFFIPVFRQRSDTAKQGSKDEFPVNLDRCDSMLLSCYDVCRFVYQELLKEGVAPEQARLVLPQAMYTSWYWTGSLAAWARFYKQRTDPHAQKEIQDLAKMIGDIIEPFFPISWKALTNNAK